MGKKLRNLAFVCVAGAFALPASAQLFATGDPILAIDTDDVVVIHSNYPDGEAPFQCFDQLSETKYLNFGKANTGVIVEPFYGSSTVVSMQFVTANDHPERDPASWELYGTNDFISSEDNSAGEGENWTLIASGDANLPDDRFAAGPIYNFANATSYSAYKVIFPTLKNSMTANSMQIAEIQVYTGSDAGGDPVCDLLDLALAVGWAGTDSDYPGLEGPANLLDSNSATKYLNFGKENSGFIVSRTDGASVTVEQFTMTTANDSQSRDPASWEIYGTNETILSTDNSRGNAENWTFIDGGAVDLPTTRLTAGPIVKVNNTTAYKSYKMVFPTLRDTLAADCDSMQVADIVIEGTGGGNPCPADINNDQILDFFDLQQFLNYFASGDIRADFAQDGVLDFFDLQTFLQLFSAGCP